MKNQFGDEILLLECDCTGEVIRFTQDKDDKDLWLSYFIDVFYSKQYSFFRVMWNRVKLAWLILAGREFTLFDVILSKEKAVVLMEWLDSLYVEDWGGKTGDE
jgi:hypothetical protein